MLRCGFLQIGKGCFGRVVGTENVNVHHALKSIGGKLVDGSKKIPSGPGSR